MLGSLESIMCGSSPATWKMFSSPRPHLSALVVNIEVPGGSIVLEGDLQPVRMSDLPRLEHGVEVLNGDDRFRTFGFLDHDKMQAGFRIDSPALGGLGFNTSVKIWDTHAGISRSPCCNKTG